MSLLFMVGMYDRTFERWPGAPPVYNYLLGGPVPGPLSIDKDSITIMNRCARTPLIMHYTRWSLCS